MNTTRVIHRNADAQLHFSQLDEARDQVSKLPICPIKTDDATYNITLPQMTSTMSEQMPGFTAGNTLNVSHRSSAGSPLETTEMKRSKAPPRTSFSLAHFEGIHEHKHLKLKEIHSKWQKTFEKEIRTWDEMTKLGKEATKARVEALSRVAEAEDCRRILHGGRRSAYLGPPRFTFDCRDLDDEICGIVERTAHAMKSLNELRRKRATFHPPFNHSAETMELTPNQSIDDLLKQCLE